MKIEAQHIKNRGIHKRELSAIIAGEQNAPVDDGEQRDRSPFVPSNGDEVLAEESLPPIDADLKVLITALMALGCQLGDGAKIAHIDDDGEWDMGKLIKTKSKEMPAPTGGTKRTGFAYKFRTSTKECWFRLRRNEYGPTKEWVAVKTRPAAAAKPPKKKKKKTTTTTSTTATTN